MSRIYRVISGGQTGVDIGSLRGAKKRGYRTGGTMPAGCRTLAGPRLDWANEFGLSAHASEAYPPRTFQNVRDSAMTVRIAFDFDSAGEKCTARAISQYRREYADVHVERVDGRLYVDPGELRAAARKIRDVAARFGGPLVLNVAGNSEQSAPGIERFAETIVGDLLDMVDSHEPL